MTAFTLAGRALLPNRRFAEATLWIDGAVIARVEPGLDPAADVRVDGWIVPGFIDLQLNGAYGRDFSTDGAGVTAVAERLPATGTTAFLATLITSPFDCYPQRLAEIAAATPSAASAAVLGVHLEGPYFNPARKGAHNPALLRPINCAEVSAWASHRLVRLVTLAPELPGGLEAVRALRARGLVVSAGHSDATYAEAQAAFAAGVGCGTHLFNAMRPLFHREPGLAGALLEAPVPCGLIADGLHVHPAALTLAYRAKGPDQVALVTDAISAMGTTPGRIQLGGQTVLVDAVSARLLDGTLAGSLLTLDQAVRNMIAFTGCSLAEAVQMASETPARILGLDHKGRLAAGCAADLVVLDDALQVVRTWTRGTLAFTA